MFRHSFSSSYKVPVSPSSAFTPSDHYCQWSALAFLASPIHSSADQSWERTERSSLTTLLLYRIRGQNAPKLENIEESQLEDYLIQAADFPDFVEPSHHSYAIQPRMTLVKWGESYELLLLNHCPDMIQALQIVLPR